MSRFTSNRYSIREIHLYIFSTQRDRFMGNLRQSNIIFIVFLRFGDFSFWHLERFTSCIDQGIFNDVIELFIAGQTSIRMSNQSVHVELMASFS